MNKLIGCALKIRDGITKNTLLRLAKKDQIEKIASKFRICDIRLFRSEDPAAYADLTNSLWMAKAKKLKTNTDKIRVAFVVAHASMWSCDELIGFLREDNRFDPYVVIAYSSSNKGGADQEAFEKTESWLKMSGYPYRKLMENTPNNKCYKQMGEPDVVFYLTPYSNLLPVGCNLLYLPADTLTIYIPYSYMLSDAPGKFTCPGMVDSWRHFADSAYYANQLIAHDPLNVRNTAFVGYPKMDIYFEPPGETAHELWKIAPGCDESKVKRIIYAPHHSLEGSRICTQHFSTFARNYKQILFFAQQNPKTTSWILKPHPVLRTTTVETGLFESSSDYDAYLDAWRALPNATVVEESTYYDIFKTSDAMILDSVSFIAEYQFTGKPLLFLTKEDQKFNAFGQSILDNLYQADGRDVEAIDAFIRDVVVDGNDAMAQKREQFFDENLNYYKKNGNVKASQQIFAELKKFVTQ